jgi:hypothetical protein
MNDLCSIVLWTEKLFYRCLWNEEREPDALRAHGFHSSVRRYERAL